jgi:hypothetical protein
MALETGTGWLVGLAAAAGAIILEFTKLAIRHFFPKKTEEKSATKIGVETYILNEKEQREKDKFCEDRLEKLEKKFSIVEDINEQLKAKYKEITQMFEASEKEKNELKIELTYARIDLAAYKPN